ncbi:MAG: tRNA lysidine(34) synthetase TilS [Desulfovibrio sp.]|nr:tRNA lysidine(34) synthetase TilS [Desulfovibrio sp.]
MERFLRGLGLTQGERLVAAVSGGADSLALVLVLRILAPRLDLHISALTVDHGLLPEAAFIAARVTEQCATLGIDCVSQKADVSGLAVRERLGIEEAGRKLRYRLLEEERSAKGAQYIALGHHRADLAEDVLMRLTRGTGWPGLGGMDARDDKRHLLRPLLFTDPRALRDILRECRISWFEDPSNADQRFKRNRIRHTILPSLKKENPSLEYCLARLWRLAQTDRDYWEKILDALTDKIRWNAKDEEISLPTELLHDLHAAIRLRLYLRVLSLLTDTAAENRHTGQARADTLLALDAALERGRGNACFQLPGGVEARLNKGAVILSRLNKINKPCIRESEIVSRSGR